ncbi:MAG: ATP-binding protein [Proteobacteria bacterium]|nr:ATP-binding protein [Pseudomonadota bacterium]
MERALKKAILKDLNEKLVLVSGPRQVGKTTLGRSLFERHEYLNYDSEDHRPIIEQKTWDRRTDLVMFDELHKRPKWKSWIKGIYDTEVRPPRILVTGSARMDVFKKGGDSLAGRHFLFRLHPLSVAELKNEVPPETALENLLRFGGFPEPFFAGDETRSKRWRISHLDRILREDLLDLEKVRELKKMQLLVDLLAERVGGPVNYANLARDLEVSPHTIKNWIGILESLFVVFVVSPFSKGLARSILKEPKVYFFDTGRVRNDPGARLENLVACSLLKDLQFREDVFGEKGSLHYVRDRMGREVDFLTVREGSPSDLVEVKVSDGEISKSLHYFRERIGPRRTIQLVQNAKRSYQGKDVSVFRASDFLSELE